MIPPNSLVFVIDDDASVRKGLARLLRSADYKSEIFESASDFLARAPHDGPSCVVVDVQMPGLTGIELQKDLIQRHREEQLVFITGHGDIPMCAEAMKAGAVDFFGSRFEVTICFNASTTHWFDLPSRGGIALRRIGLGVFLVC